MLTQYQALAYPVPQDAETITPDKWAGCAEMPTYRRPRAAEGDFGTSWETSLTTPVAIDWWREAERPRNPVRPRLAGGNAHVAEPTTTTPITIDWWREAERPRNPANRLVPEGEFASPPEEPSETAREHGWQAETGRPRPRRTRRPDMPPPFAPEPTTLEELANDWDMGPVARRNVVRPRRHQVYAASPEPSVVVPYVLDWLREAERPRNPVRHPQHRDFTPEHSQPVPPSDWLPPSPMVVYRRPHVRPGTYIAQVVIDQLDIAWMRDGDRPRAGVGLRSPSYPTSPFLDMTEPPAGWLVPCDVRVLLRRPAWTEVMPPIAPAPILPPSALRPDDRDATGDEAPDADLAGG